jgi:signal transduction histidine kinase
MLQRRDLLLDVTAQATNVLLTVENLNQAINTALGIIGEGIDCDIVSVLENVFEPPSPLPVQCNFIYEWAAAGLLPITTTFGATCLPAELIGSDVLERLRAGEAYGGRLEVWEEPMYSALASVQIQSAYAVPIRVNGQWWGALCLDYCRAPVPVSSAEIAVLRTIADCIGSAIQRDRTQKMLLQAEQAKVAELAKANSALKQSLDALAVDPDLDRLIGNILRLIAQQFDAPRLDYSLRDPAAGTWHLQLAYWQGQLRRAATFAGAKDSSDHGGSPRAVPFLSILLAVGDTTLGALTVYLASPRAFSQETMELAHALAQQLTLAVELTRLAEEAQQAALLQERTHMAREIHDTLAQSFCGILMQLQIINCLIDTQPEQAQTHLLAAQAQAKDGLDAARRSVWTLYLESEEYEDPAHTIAKFIEQVSLGQSVSITLAIEGTPYRLNPDVGLNLLRIAQEAIANALRHAQPRTICLGLSYGPQALRLTVQDDGCGFDPQLPSRGFGLLGMQERATRIGGTWHLASQSGQGTVIMVTIGGLSPNDLSSNPPEESLWAPAS